MMNPALRPDASLAEVLATRARRSSDGRLVLDVVGGLLLAAITAVLRPPAWLILFCVGVCFGAFGSWGIADRELRERVGAPPSRTVLALEGLRLLATVVGILAAVAMIFSVLGLALGTWIS